MVLWLQGQAGAGDCWARVVAEREEGGHVLALVNVIGTWDESEEAQRWNLNFHCGGAATGGPMCGDEVEVSLAMSQALRAGSGDSPPQKHSVMAKRDSRPTSGEVPSAFLSTECCSVVLSDPASPPELGGISGVLVCGPFCYPRVQESRAAGCCPGYWDTQRSVWGRGHVQ